MSDLALFVFVTFVTCATPGAGVLYTVSSAFRGGLVRAWQAPLGNAAGVLAMSILSATGMGAVIAASPVLFYGLQSIGALVLFWLGVKSWRAPAIDFVRLAQSADGSAKRGSGYFWAAAVLQTTNPMLIVYLLSLLPQFVSPTESNYAQHATILIALFALICLVVHLGYSYAACFIGSKIRGERFSFWLNRVSAVLFWLLSAGVFVGFLQTGAP